MSDLPYVGYSKLRPGRIHLFCPSCKRKQSNAPRMTQPLEDPSTAVLCIVACDKCSAGTKDGSMKYRDAKGRWVCEYCGGHDCDRVDGTKDCTEELLRPLRSRGLTEREKA